MSDKHTKQYQYYYFFWHIGYTFAPAILITPLGALSVIIG